MNLGIIRLKTETEDILRSKTKNCETLINQAHRKPQETLELRLNNQGKLSHLKHPFNLDLTLNGWLA